MLREPFRLVPNKNAVVKAPLNVRERKIGKKEKRKEREKHLLPFYL